MSTRTSFHHGQLKKALLEEAMIQIENNGLDALSLRDLADSIGVAKSAPYRHFANKNALIVQIVENVQNDLYEAYSSISLDLAPTQRLRLASAEYLNFARSHPNLFRLLVLENRYWEQAGLERPRSSRSPLALFVSLVRDAMPGSDDAAVRLAAITCWSALQGFAHLRYSGRLGDLAAPPFSEMRFLDQLMTIVSGCKQ